MTGSDQRSDRAALLMMAAELSSEWSPLKEVTSEPPVIIKKLYNYILKQKLFPEKGNIYIHY